jgi:hypothetical protein
LAERDFFGYGLPKKSSAVRAKTRQIGEVIHEYLTLDEKTRISS